jgi:hypothetical protein
MKWGLLDGLAIGTFITGPIYVGIVFWIHKRFGRRNK